MTTKKIIKKGEMIVLTNAKTKKECVFYITDDFPFKEMNKMIGDGIFKTRMPTREEKEYCYWCYETMNKEGADLDGINIWRQSRDK